MKISVYGRDWLIIDESNIEESWEGNEKTHLIKFALETPTSEKVDEVLDRFPSTNRFIIDSNIKFYNDLLKNRKKYYVENKPRVGLISFFKKNNKVLLNIENLTSEELGFVESQLSDILKNLEAIYIDSRDKLKDDWLDQLRFWPGNLLVYE